MVRRATARLFSRLTPSTERAIPDLLRNERVGGLLMLLGTIVALVWANSAFADGYTSLREIQPIGEQVGVFGLSLHLDLTLQEWATDALLAVFFFVIGLELKREIVVGELRRPGTAVVPIVAAIGGMVVPAGLYLAVNAFSEDGVLDGWAVPTATDIAFALAVVSVVGRRLPTALRAFLLTLAVVDDLLAIIIIALFYSAGFAGGWLIASGVAIAVFAFAVRRRVSPWLLVPLAAVVWMCMHESGVHATIAGVAIGLTVPALRREGEETSTVEHWEHSWSPFSTSFAVPIFAFFAAGVVLDVEALGNILADAPSRGVMIGLLIGKPLGIVLATWLVATLTRASLDRGLSWWDVVGVSWVAGIGFTVSLLIGGLAFGAGSEQGEYVKAAVLLASGTAAVIGASILWWRDRYYRDVYERSASSVSGGGAAADDHA